LPSLYPEGEVILNVDVTEGLTSFLTAPAFFTAAVHLILPSKRKYPQSVVTWYSVAISIAALAMWIPIYVGFQGSVCNNEYDAVST